MESPSVGKNDPCPCGSGKKYRQCCWLNRFEKTAPVNRVASANGSPPRTFPEPDLPVKVFRHERRQWADTRLADVQAGQEFIADNCLYKRLSPAVIQNNPLVDVRLIPEADRPYEPHNWRAPRGHDVVYALEADGSPIGHCRLARVAPGQRCIFQGLIYHIEPGPTFGTAKLVGSGEVDHRPDDRLYVWVEYTIDDALGHAEVGYRYPLGQLIPLTNGDAVPVEGLTAGTSFVLEEGGSAVVRHVGPPKRWEPDREFHDEYGNGFRRVVGTFKFTGWVEIMTVTVGGLTHEVTPGHPYWSESRRGWFPIGSFEAGELLLAEEGQRIPIEAITPPLWRNETVYNFEVDEYHTYFVGRGTTAVWCHNGMGDACGVPTAARTGKGPYTEAEANFLARLAEADAHLHKRPAAYTAEQLETAILLRRRREAGDLKNLTEQDWDMLARLHAAALNTGQAKPLEVTTLGLRTQARIHTVAGKNGYLNPDLVPTTSASSTVPTIGYDLTKAQPGKFLWQVKDRRQIALKSTIPDEVIHIGETTQFSIPAGKPWADAVFSRYTQDWLRKYKITITPRREPAAKQVLLDWQDAQIQAFISNNTHRPGLPPVANLNGR